MDSTLRYLGMSVLSIYWGIISYVGYRLISPKNVCNSLASITILGIVLPLLIYGGVFLTKMVLELTFD